MVSFSSVTRGWFSIDGNCDRRCFRSLLSDLISGVKIGVKFLMHPARIWRWLVLVITLVSFAAAASIVLKLGMSTFYSVVSVSSVKGDQFAFLYFLKMWDGFG